MVAPHRVGDLEIHENTRFQEWEWKVQRIAWVLLLLIVFLALAGLFGTGPLSSATVESDDDALSVGYERFIRHDGRTTVTIEVDGDQAPNGEIEVWLSQPYLEDFELQNVSPQPSDVISAGARTIYVFPVEDASSPLTVTFSLRPQGMGRIAGEAGLPDGPTVTFDHLSFP